jgi:colanic acid/amylovoran biosynthesis protein
VITMIEDHMTDRPLRIGVLGATFETPNMGVGALAAGAVQCLLRRYPGSSIFFLDYGREATIRTVRIDKRTVQVSLVNMRFSKKFYLSNNIVVLLLLAIVLRIAPSTAMRRWLISKNKYLREICQADLFTSVAGGDSFSDIYGVSRFLYVSLPQILVLLLEKRLILLPQTYGPFHRRSMKLIARYIVAGSEQAYCRDYHSLDRLMGESGNNAEQSQRSFCYDMAFGINAIAPLNLSVTGLSLKAGVYRTLIGINISGLLFMGGYTRKNAFALRSDYRQLMHDLIEYLNRRTNAAVLLIPHVFGAEPGSESDVLACAQVFEKLRDKYPDRLGLLCGSYDQNEIKYVIGLCDFFVGSRMHACIAAISQLIPAVAIAYSDKFLGVIETIGVSSLSADARKLDHDEVLIAVDRAFHNRGTLARELQRKMPIIRETVGQLLSQVEARPKHVSPAERHKEEKVGA